MNFMGIRAKIILAATISLTLLFGTVSAQAVDSSLVPGSVEIVGSGKLGTKINLVIKPEADPSNLRIQWLRSGEVIQEASSSVYIPVEEDLGKEISALISSSVDNSFSLTTNSVLGINNDTSGVSDEVESLIVTYEPDFKKSVETQVSASVSEADDSLEVDSVKTVQEGMSEVSLSESIPVNTALSIADELVQRPGISTAEPNYKLEIPEEIVSSASEQISLAGLQSTVVTGLDRIDQRTRPTDGFYGYDSEGSGVRAYVVDTGIYDSHYDFQGRVTGGYTAYPNDGCGTDDFDGHGTHVAGTIGGATVGVAKKVTLVPVRVFDCYGNGTLTSLIQGINWIIADHQAGAPAVANFSLGAARGLSATVDAAVTSLINDGVSVVVASGNDGTNACYESPAHLSRAITVNAATSYDTDAYFSNYGSCTDLYAPGVDVWSASYIDIDGWDLMSGTSQAAPHVAGAVARLLGQNPSLTPDQVAAKLLAQTTYVNFGIGYGDPNKLLFMSGASTQTSLIKALYFDVLGRTPEPYGLGYWLGVMVSQGQPPSVVANGVLNSDEYYLARISDAYRSVLNRAPEVSGKLYWLQQIQTGRVKVDDVAMIFTQSDEFFAGRAGSNNQRFVSYLFEVLLKRTATPADQANWAQIVVSQGRAAVINTIYNSGESAARRIDTQYSRYFQRNADPTGLATWTPLVISQGDQVLRSMIVNSAEYQNRATIRYPS